MHRYVIQDAVCVVRALPAIHRQRRNTKPCNSLRLYVTQPQRRFFFPICLSESENKLIKRNRATAVGKKKEKEKENESWLDYIPSHHPGVTPGTGVFLTQLPSLSFTHSDKSTQKLHGTAWCTGSITSTLRM